MILNKLVARTKGRPIPLAVSMASPRRQVGRTAEAQLPKRLSGQAPENLQAGDACT